MDYVLQFCQDGTMQRVTVVISFRYIHAIVKILFIVLRLNFNFKLILMLLTGVMLLLMTKAEVAQLILVSITEVEETYLAMVTIVELEYVQVVKVVLVEVKVS